MREHLRLSPRLSEELAMLKTLELTVGLDLDAANKHPSELSGGMTKRGRLGEGSGALDPELVFLDEPTSWSRSDRRGGVRRIDRHFAANARSFTVFMVTHDLDSLSFDLATGSPLWRMEKWSPKGRFRRCLPRRIRGYTLIFMAKGRVSPVPRLPGAPARVP